MIEKNKRYSIADLTKMQCFPWIVGVRDENHRYRRYQWEVTLDRRANNFLESALSHKSTSILGANLIKFLQQKRGECFIRGRHLQEVCKKIDTNLKGYAKKSSKK